MELVKVFFKAFFIVLGVVYFIAFIFDKFFNTPLDNNLFAPSLIGAVIAVSRAYAKYKKETNSNVSI